MVKEALEYLFFSGAVGSAGRTPQFERRYDVIERVLPRGVHETPTPSNDEAFRALTRIAARAHGVATEPDLRDYFRLKPPDSQRAVAELVDVGRAPPGAGRGLGAARPTCIATPACRAASRPARCWRRSTRWSGSATGSSSSSTSTTASRSTSSPRSGSSATTCCRSCSTTPSWPGSTSRPTARRGPCWCRPRGPRSARPSTPPRSCWPSCGSWPRWLDLDDVVIVGRGDAPRRRAQGPGPLVEGRRAGPRRGGRACARRAARRRHSGTWLAAVPRARKPARLATAHEVGLSSAWKSSTRRRPSVAYAHRAATSTARAARPGPGQRARPSSRRRRSRTRSPRCTARCGRSGCAAGTEDPGAVRVPSASGPVAEAARHDSGLGQVSDGAAVVLDADSTGGWRGPPSPPA